MSGYSKYPNNLDDSTTLPLSSDNVTAVKAEVVNRLRSAILSIEAELGINPSGSFGTVRDRLDSIIAGSGSGTGAISVQLNSSVVNSNTLTVNFAGDVTASTQSPTRVLVTVGGNTTQVQETIVVTNGQTSITLTGTPLQSNNVEMFINGIKQNYGADYTVSNRIVNYFSTITLISADIVEFIYFKTNVILASEMFSSLKSLIFDIGLSNPEISQSANITNSATGQLLKIQAQNATGITTIGGGLTLASGTGTSIAGNVLIKCGSTTAITCTAATAITTITGNLNITGLTASQAVVTDSSNNLVSLNYTTTATASTLVKRDSSGNINVVGLNASTLSVSQAVVTDGSKNLASLVYTTAATVSTLAQRDSSGNLNVVGLNASTLTASQLVSTDSSKNLASFASGNYGEMIVGNSTSGWFRVGVQTGTDLTDTSPTLTLAGGHRYILPAATLSTNRTATLSTSGATNGAVFQLWRFDVTANTYTITNGGTSGGTAYTFPASTKIMADFRYDSALNDWVLAGWTKMVSS